MTMAAAGPDALASGPGDAPVEPAAVQTKPPAENPQAEENYQTNKITSQC